VARLAGRGTASGGGRGASSCCGRAAWAAGAAAAHEHVREQHRREHACDQADGAAGDDALDPLRAQARAVCARAQA